MLNLVPRSIGAVSGINTSVVLVQSGYVGLVQVSGYYRVYPNTTIPSWNAAGYPACQHLHRLSNVVEI